MSDEVDSPCGTCRFYNGNGHSGSCMNFLNADVKYVGGGEEYSSSEQCFVPAKVEPLMSCGHYEFGSYQRPAIALVPEAIRRARWEEEQRNWNGQTTRTVWAGDSPFGTYLAKVGGIL